MNILSGRWPTITLVLALVLFAAAASSAVYASDSAATLYQQLRTVGLDKNAIYRVRGAGLDREDLHVSFDRGIIAFTRAVDGRVTGAFFQGDGEVLLAPPDRVERASLGLFTGAAVLDERFTSAYLRFNDNTRADLESALRPLAAEAPAEAGETGQTEEEQPEDSDRRAFPQRADSALTVLAPASALRVLATFLNAASRTSDGNIAWQQPANDRFLHLRLAGRKLGIFDVIFDSQLAEQLAVIQPSEFNGAGRYNIWTSFPVRSARARVAATASGAAPAVTTRTQTAAEEIGNPWRLARYHIRAQVSPPRQLQADAGFDLTAAQPAGRVVVFELSRHLAVKQVLADGQPVEYIQNQSLEGSELARRGDDLVAVILPSAPPPGTPIHLQFHYDGDVLADAGGGLLYVGARGMWYPNVGFAMCDFDLEFHYPSGWTLIATGKPMPPAVPNAHLPAAGAQLNSVPPALPQAASPPPSSPQPTGAPDQVARFVSERPIPVAGFNLGRFVKAEAKAEVRAGAPTGGRPGITTGAKTGATTGDVLVDAYATRSVERDLAVPQGTTAAVPPVDPFTGQLVGVPIVETFPAASPRPSAHLQKIADTTAASIDFLSARLGPFPYSELAVTQGPGLDSQSWPGLVFLSSVAFLTPEERARMNIGEFGEVVYSRVMPAHETGHQWWGDLLIWKSYREQWLVEALANYCAALMLEAGDPAAFRLVMDHYRRDLVEKNKDGQVISEAGPVTLGLRLDSSRFPGAYDTVAYERGTWLFHMLHSLLLNENQPSSPDPFFNVLRGLRERFEGKDITTRDVQQAFEDALPESVRYENRKSLEWFFDGWVNGTSVPTLELEAVRLAPRGAETFAAGNILQKFAAKDLVTSVPLYADTGGPKPVFAGRIFAEGAETPFRLKVPAHTRRLFIDPFGTLLTRP